MNIIGRRYQLYEQLGEGGMGAVYRAVDRLNGQTVALKQVTTHKSSSDNTVDNSTNLRIALAQEFKVLASLRHPNIINVLDYGFASGDDHSPQPYFTMELLADAQTVLEAGYEQPLNRQVDLLVQMLQALAYLHRREIIHRDLKPNNALVGVDEDGNPVVKVLDFGLSTRREQSSGGQVVGTLSYMAPEMLQGDAVGEASDLYALGVIAFELFAGRHPFDTSNPTQLIRDILTTPPDVWSLSVNEDLILVVERLLNKSPDNRYADAESAIKALCTATGRPLPRETSAIRESFLQAAQMIGRDDEMAVLSDALDNTLNATGSTWLIGGESGAGKSRLVDELRTLGLVEGALVMRGQCISEGGSPYELWRDTLRWVALLSDVKDLEASALKAIIPDLPLLLEREIAESPITDAMQARDRLLAVVEDLFHRYMIQGDRVQPILMILEDLHWASGESLTLLTRLNGMVKDHPLMIVASYRDDERQYLPTELPDMRVVKLERLTLHSIEELSVAMLGDAGRKQYVVDFLERETEGNIYFIVEVVRALAEEAGRLGEVGEMTLPMGVFAGGVQNILQRRLGRVPEKDRALLRIAAVLGRWIDPDVLAVVAPDVVLDTWLTDCANVAVLDIQDGRWRFAHDKLRDRLLGETTDEDRCAIHRRVAEALEQAYPDDEDRASALAYHWRTAGDSDKELHYSIVAGRRALTGTSFLDAANHLERAAQLKEDRTAPGDNAARRDLAYLKQELGQAYYGLGEYMQARYLHEDSLAILKDLDDRPGIARAHMLLGEVAYAQNEYSEAGRLQQQAVEQAEVVADRPIVARALTNRGRVAHVTGDYDAARDDYNRALTISREIGDQRVEARLLSSLGHVARDLGDYAEGRRLCLESIALCEALGDQQGIAAAYSTLGTIAQTVGEYAASEQYYRHSIAICEAIGDRYGQAEATNRLGDVAFALKEYVPAWTHYQDALAMFTTLGSKRGITTALTGLGNVAIATEDYAEAKSTFEQTLAICRELGDRRGVVMALNNLGNATYCLGQDAEAWRYYRTALKDALAMEVTPLVLDVLDGMAGLLVRSDEQERAAELIGFILSHPAIEKQGQNYSEGLLNRLGTGMSSEALRAAQARGAARNLQAVTAELLRDGADPAAAQK